MRFIKDLILIWKWIYVHLFAWIFYDKKYLRGRWFSDGIRSLGWIWASRDIHYRLHTLKHLNIRWPISPEINIGDNIEFDPDDLNNMNGFGNYFQTMDGKITIGKGTYIAPNVGIITTNHDMKNLDEHLPGKDVIIGEHCWIGMNCVILPGIILGEHTIVGAGSVVTKSFKEGNCVIVGNPARKVKDL
jgi:acetyltransferase-like isoleucine patch superfamily enzyme